MVTVLMKNKVGVYARALLRGGYWGGASSARRGFVVSTSCTPTNTNTNIGFRADLKKLARRYILTGMYSVHVFLKGDSNLCWREPAKNVNRVGVIGRGNLTIIPI